MNNLTQRTLLVILFVIASLGVVWANGSTSTSEENTSTTKTSGKSVIPARPVVEYVGIDRCGYQSIGDPVSVVIVRATGCGSSQTHWYDSNNNDLGLDSPGRDLKFLEITSNITVYAKCYDGFGFGDPSNSVNVQYQAAPSTIPTITLDRSIACDGEKITLKSSITNPNYEYRWERTLGINNTPSAPNIIDHNTEGFGTPTLKATLSGYYYLSVVSPSCPQAPAYASGVVFAEFYSLPKPVITASATTFCEDNGITLKTDSLQFIKSYQWYLNGVRQPNMGTISHIEKFQKTGSVQVVSVEARLGCLSPISNPVTVQAIPVPAKPVITASALDFCEDKGISLKTDSSSIIKNYQWFLNGVRNNNLGTISHIDKFYQTGSVQVIAVEGVLNCISPISEAVSLKAVPVPTKPVITASALEFCEDKTVSLKATSSAIATSFQWFINGAKQDTLGTTNTVDSFNKTASIQIIGVESVLGCLSPISNTVNLTALALPAKPVISSSKLNATICDGDVVMLTSTSGFSYTWNTGATTRSIDNIKTSGKYALKVTDEKGCVSKSSDTTTVIVNALPAKPVITASGVLAFCDGGAVTLTSTPNVKYVWSNNEATQAITIKTSQDLTVAVIDANNCKSPASDLVKVTVYALPAKPTITSSSSLAFCADQSVIITSSDLPNGEVTKYLWSSADVTKSITVKTTGTFFVKVIDPRGCVSPSSDIVTTTALPVPDAPTIAADGLTIFCSRDNADYSKINSVNLLATSNFEVTWSTGLVGKTLNLTSINSQGTFIDISREYTATAKNTTTGCVSAKSAPINIIVRNNPDASAASIEKDGTYTLKAVNFPTGNEYEWKYGSEVLAFKEGVIKANRYGDYSARVKTVFAIASAPGGQLACFSNFSKAFTFSEEAIFKGLSIYPNPSNGLLTIETLADYDNPQILIYDLLGRQIYASTLPTIKGKVIVDLRNNNEGEYMLRFKAGDFDLTKRIIVNR
ncbi:T9SS type A sorting domain-containing protein [Arcicella lustrica]|uniref:T9SS type A sorting domain-containing protein n=1 Tax=Arcicella lustrica TaxID=2984196 RepID=A0ABU5SFL7_9BACT|nr:T9SS type A sorting domain-containing protein [Arcicella sp. DC25W]MEA5426085.1 T9SS type A sorting domain-containing protein [Arcicella sp. DC25W]